MITKSPARPARLIAGLLSLILCSCVASSNALGQLPGAAPAASAPSADEQGQANPLAETQAQVAQRFKRLESVLLRSAEIEAATNPTRAELLTQAAKLAQELQLANSLSQAAKSLEQKQYRQAVDDQKVSRDNLKKILELLQYENRPERDRQQRDQVKRWIEEADRLLRLQSSLRGRTEGGTQTQKAAGDQEKLAEKAGQIAKELAPDQEANSQSQEDSASKDQKSGDQSQPNQDSKDKPQKDSDKDSSNKDDQNKENQNKENQNKENQNKENQNKGDQNKGDQEKGDQSNNNQQSDQAQKDGQNTDGKNKDSQNKDANKNDGQSKDGQNKDGKSKDDQNKDGQSQDGQKSEDGKGSQDSSKPSQDGSQESQPGSENPSQSPGQKSESQEGQQPQPKNATERAAQKIKQAQQRMREAQQKLEKAERDGAVEKQRQAEQELQQALEQLEEILRQLREEEIERSLAALEERLRLMLRLENKVLDDTKRLQEIGGNGTDRQVEIRAGGLAGEQRKILNEGQRALLLLREEGTSAAFPEDLEQIIRDMQSVADRLAKADIGQQTVNLEQEIVSALEDLVAALADVQKDKKQRKQQPQVPGQGSPGQGGEQPLVDKLAEMRLIKTMQLRINRRTQSLSEALKDPNDSIGQAQAEDLLSQLKELAERQAKIKQVTRDIVAGSDNNQ